MSKWWFTVIALAACGDDGGGDGAADAAMLPPFDCAMPSQGTHKVFLNFDGVTLTRGSPSDATQNISSAIDASKTMATIAAWKATASDRIMQIQTIVCAMRESYYAYDVDFVTSRPASGDYEMIVFGGQPLDLGYNFGGSTAMTGIAANDCGNVNMRDLAWVAEHPINNNPFTEAAAASAVHASAFLGAGNALAVSKDPKNCMCPLASGEQVTCELAKTCSLSASSPIPMGGNPCNVAGTTEDQIAKLTSRYGAR